MFTMQTFYNQIQEEHTSYLGVLRRIFGTSRALLLQLSSEDGWDPWGE